MKNHTDLINVGTFFVAVHPQEMKGIPDADWQRQRAFFAQNIKGDTFRLVAFGNSGPSAKQRKDMSALLRNMEHKNINIYVFTRALISRMALRALTLMGYGTRSFDLSEIDTVMTLLDATPREIAQTRALAARHGYLPNRPPPSR